MALPADDKMLFTANDTSMTETASNMVVKKIKAGTGPCGVIAPAR